MIVGIGSARQALRIRERSSFRGDRHGKVREIAKCIRGMLGISPGCAWDVHGMCLGRPWDVLGTSMDCLGNAR